MSEKNDLSDYFHKKESPLGFCHRRGTFSFLYGKSCVLATNMCKSPLGLGGNMTDLILYTSDDGKAYQTKLYNLDLIVATGYRIRSSRVSPFAYPPTYPQPVYPIFSF